MDEPQWTIEDAEEAYSEGDLEQALVICEQLLEGDPGDVDTLFLMGEALLELNEFEAAEEVYRDASLLDPESGSIRNGLGVALFELCRFDEARAMLRGALELDPRLAESRLYLGYLHERRGEAAAYRDELQRAVEVDPEHYHLPTPVDVEDLTAAIEQLAHALPPRLRDVFAAATWRVEDLPTTHELTRHMPPLSPLILCLMPGPTRDPESTPDPLDHPPTEIVLFRANFEKSVPEPAQLPHALLHAVLSELEHFLDLDAAEREALALDAILEAHPLEPSSSAADGPPRTLH